MWFSITLPHSDSRVIKNTTVFREKFYFLRFGVGDNDSVERIASPRKCEGCVYHGLPVSLGHMDSNRFPERRENGFTVHSYLLCLVEILEFEENHGGDNEISIRKFLPSPRAEELRIAFVEPYEDVRIKEDHDSKCGTNRWRRCHRACPGEHQGASVDA